MASATGADLLAMKATIDAEVRVGLITMKAEIEGNALVEINKAVTNNAESQKALIKRLG